MKKLWVTGASGFLGWHLCQLTKQSWAVWGAYWTQSIETPEINLVQLDLTDYPAVKRAFKQIQPDAVIHTAAQSKPNFCQTHPDETYPINVTASVNLANLCAEAAIPYVFTSTDLVFDGRNPPYREADPMCPINHYGEQKAIAEDEILRAYPQAAICRMPLMFGAKTPTAQSFLQPWLKTLRAGKPLKLFTDEFRTPISANTAATGLLLALNKVNGRLHLGGHDTISRFEFGRLLAEAGQFSPHQLQPCLQQDMPMPAPRPKNVSMDSAKAFALGYAPPQLKPELAKIVGRG
ncbi:MAG: NAD(P)-dependent oxidoreductase [Leptolyngbyaceae cyanobacterium MO_188.B28]|nr:NAD(P)-dependent oxidoreductase [Leptolyngbyaceae cyanobacterium MO_188.B28]